MNQHLIIVNYAYQSEIADPPTLIKQYFNLSCWAKACVLTGAKVTVFQRFKQDHRLSVDGVDYVFVSDSLRPLPAYYHCTLGFNRKINHYLNSLTNSQIALHINGLIFPLSVLQLTRAIDNNLKVVIQHHAESPVGKLFKRLNRWANKPVDAFFFTTKTHAQPWVAAKTMDSHKVVELMECSSTCRAQDKSQAREKLGLVASPLLLWTGNLDENKDPLTILAGFQQFVSAYPEAKLVMLFRHNRLLVQVKQTIAASDKLKSAVILIGEVDYQQIEDYYNSADIFVQGSATEGSGIAVLDALACGAIPVISNIPSFVELTNNASVGRLWQRGKVKHFVEALHSIMSEDLVQQQQACIELFNQRWTFESLANQAMEHYFDRG